MFCQNCGFEIKNPEIYCPNCGAKLEKSMSEKKAADRMIMVRKKKTGKWFFVPVCMVIGVMAFTMHGRKSVIDLNDYYTIETYGYNGDGYLDVSFDVDKFQEDYEDKFSLNEKEAVKWLKEQYGDDDAESVTLGLEMLKNYDPVEVISDELENEPFEVSSYDELSNGDKVTFSLDEDDEESVKFIENLYGCKLKKLKSYTVKGLEK